MASPSRMFDLFGGFSGLGFLLVYSLVALSSLRKPLPGCSCRCGLRARSGWGLRSAVGAGCRSKGPAHPGRGRTANRGTQPRFRTKAFSAETIHSG